MNKNTKLEIAVEIIAAKIAKAAKEGYSAKNEKMRKLLDERNKMYIGDEEIINKILIEYGSEVKCEYDNIEGE